MHYSSVNLTEYHSEHVHPYRQVSLDAYTFVQKTLQNYEAPNSEGRKI